MISAVDKIVESFLGRELFSGVILLARDGKPLYQKACGDANRSYKIENRLETRFATASLTKMFTAVAVLKLVEAGEFDLDTGVADYLGLLPSRISRDLTVHHLLTHTSGISDYYDVDDPNGFEHFWRSLGATLIDKPERLLPFFMDEPPSFNPGEQFDYCGANYILLGLMIEKAAGSPFDQWITRSVFQKAGMNHSAFIPMDQVTMDVAEGYIPVYDGDRCQVGWRKNYYSVPAFGLPDGGAYCTAWDLVHFMGALRGDVLLTPKYRKEMLTPQVSVGRRVQYGYGVWINQEPTGLFRYGHTGEDPGVSTRLYHYEPFDLDVVILGNQSYCAGDLDWHLNRLFVEEAEKIMG